MRPIKFVSSKEELELIKYDPIKIAELELRGDVLPITVKRPLPRKSEKGSLEDSDAKQSDKRIDELEEQEEKNITEEGEIMELANPEDEGEEAVESGDEAGEGMSE